MDMAVALSRVPEDVVVCGNLDPVGVFVQSSPAEITTRALSLLNAAAAHRNFVLSSGCDVPATAPLASLDAFYTALKIMPAPHR
jgi:uroporphyrinogen decarboxylase